MAISYDRTATGLTVGSALSAVSATCFDWSDALMIRVCVPPSTTTCDYTVGDVITLRTTGGTVPANTPTRYVLVNAQGVMVQIVNTPTFSTAGLPPGPYAAYALVYTDDGSLTNLQTGQLLTAVRADCLSVSDSLRLNLCLNCGVPRCIPITVTRVR